MTLKKNESFYAKVALIKNPITNDMEYTIFLFDTLINKIIKERNEHPKDMFIIKNSKIKLIKLTP